MVERTEAPGFVCAHTPVGVNRVESFAERTMIDGIEERGGIGNRDRAIEPLKEKLEVAEEAGDQRGRRRINIHPAACDFMSALLGDSATDTFSKVRSSHPFVRVILVEQGADMLE